MVGLGAGIGRGLPVGRGGSKRKRVNDAAHAIFAVRVTKVGICARLTKRVLINGPGVRKNSRVAIGIVR